MYTLLRPNSLIPPWFSLADDSIQSKPWVPFPLRLGFWVPFVTLLLCGAIALEVALYFSNKYQGLFFFPTRSELGSSLLF
jgi:hypothetical protein